MKNIIRILSTILLILTPLLLKASETLYEEVPYDDLIEELNHRVKQKTKVEIIQQHEDPFDNVTIHSSFGLLQSIHYLQLPTKTKSRFKEGISMGFGLDLFNPNWIAEAVLKNYGHSVQNDEHMSLREFDLCLSFKEEKKQSISYKLTQGLGARYLKYASPFFEKSFNESTPVYLLGASIDSHFSQHFSFGVELSGTIALINESIDRNSLNLNFKFDNYF